jgi:hypothetical protein
MRSVVSLALAAAARSSLVLLAFAPALWLAVDCGLGYHAASLAAAVAYGVAGLAALGVLVRGIGAGEGRVLTTLAFIAMFFAVGGQTAWILRPYLVRPRTQNVPFLRALEGGFADALFTSGRSAAGVYEDDLSTRLNEDTGEPLRHAVEAERTREGDEAAIRTRDVDDAAIDNTREGSLR